MPKVARKGSTGGASNENLERNGGGGHLHNLKIIIDARIYAWYNDITKIVLGSRQVLFTRFRLFLKVHFSDLSKIGIRDLKAVRLLKRVSRLNANRNRT